MNWASREFAERGSRGQAGRDEIYGPATELMLDVADVRTGSRALVQEVTFAVIFHRSQS
jgi:hypothetical protein